MPREEGYEQRVTPQPAAARPLANAAAYGSELGGAIERAGGEAHSAMLRDYQIERRLTADRESTDASSKMASGRVASDTAIGVARDNPNDPDYSDHQERVSQSIDAAMTPALEGITDTATRNAITRQINSFKGETLAREQVWVQGKRTAKMIGDMGQRGDLASGRVAVQPDMIKLDHVIQEEIKASGDAWDGVSNADPEVRAKGMRGDVEKLGIAYFKRAADLDPTNALAMLDSGGAAVFGLSGEQIDALRTNARVELNRQKGAVQQSQAVAKSDYKDRLAAAMEMERQGIPVSPEQWGALHAEAVAYGEEQDQVQIAGVAANSAIARVFEGQTPLQKETARRELAAIPEDKRSDDQNRAFQWLNTAGREQDARFRANPLGWATQYGSAAVKPPPLTAGLAARRDWSRRVAPVFGMVPSFFSPDEAALMRTNSQASPQGQLNLANELAPLGVADAQRAARMIDPADAMLQRLVNAPQSERAAYKAGSDVRRTNQDIIDKGNNADSARTAFRQYVGTAIDLFRPADREAMFDMSRSLYAGDASHRGDYTYTGRKYAPFIDRGLGGGIAEWKNGNKVLMPPGYTEDQFMRTLDNWTPQAGPNQPWRGDLNRPMTKEELLRFTPTRRPDGHYEFHGNGRVVVRNKAGGIYTARPPDRP